MSKISKAVAEMQEENSLRRDETVKNFMGGDSYVINPLETLKMISASSIYGEPSYYRPSKSHKRYVEDVAVKGFTIIPEYVGKTTDEIFEDAIDKALSYDFKGTLEWAVYLRQTYNMRLNPQVIMVRAGIHPDRAKFTDANPGLFNQYEQVVMDRADEAMSQMSYYLYKNKGKKNNIPTILKKSWARNLSKQKRYHVAKYKNHEIGMINAVRLCHAHSDVIDELMRTGTVAVSEDEKTWENLRSEGKSWKYIFENVTMGHMALLRNLRGVFEEVYDINFCKKYLEKLKSGVLTGKQFPFRYYSALKAVDKSLCNHRSLIMDCLEECMDISMQNMPKLTGKTMCLSDNSGSAWGAFNSEYGTVTVAEIDNLSSVITASLSDEGYIGKFGDRLKVIPASKRNGILSQAKSITTGRYDDVGGNTEGGIWKFFKNAIDKKEHWDNIFIYSDMQAGHGGLYGEARDMDEYCTTGYSCNGRFINVFKLIQDYRKLVNPKVNIVCVQTAGYDNVLVPEMTYRCAIQYGWTGKESVFADEYFKQWDCIDAQKEYSKNN